MTWPRFWCPVHEEMATRCNVECEPMRQAFRRVSADFRQYWYDRKSGMRPAVGLVLRCAWCLEPFIRTHSRQRYCSRKHRRRAIWARWMQRRAARERVAA